MIDFEPNTTQLKLLEYLRVEPHDYRTVQSRWQKDLLILRDGGFIQLSGKIKTGRQGDRVIYFYRARISKKGLKALLRSRRDAEAG